MVFGKGVKIREEIPFGLQRKVSAHKTTESWNSIPHSGGCINYDMTNVIAFVNTLKKDPKYQALKVSINTVMLKILAEAIKESPLMNAYLEYDDRNNKGKLTLFEDINIAIPVIIPGGENITPTIYNVGNKSVEELCVDAQKLQQRIQNTNSQCLLFSAAMEDTMHLLKTGHICKVFRRAKSNLIGKHKVKRPSKEEMEAYKAIPDEEKITPNDLRSSTILISNIGSVFRKMPLTITLLEIIAPHTCVIGLGTVQDEYVVINGTPTVRKIMPITYYFDHRGLDFSDTVGFLERLNQISENPEKLIKI